MLEIMTELPVHILQKININNFDDIKHKLRKFLNISEFYNLVIPCLKEDPKERPAAEVLLNLYNG